MKTFSMPRVLAAVAAACLAATALLVPMHHAEARKGGSASVRDHRTPAPIVGDRTNPSSSIRSTTSQAGTVKKLGCTGPYCAPTTGTNKAGPVKISGTPKIRDHRKPNCVAPGHCKPRPFYFYNGQRILLRPSGH